MTLNVSLNLAAARTDLTDRECAKVVGGVVGALVGMATPENVLRGLRWWVERPEVVIAMQEGYATATGAVMGAIRESRKGGI